MAWSSGVLGRGVVCPDSSVRARGRRGDVPRHAGGRARVDGPSAAAAGRRSGRRRWAGVSPQFVLTAGALPPEAGGPGTHVLSLGAYLVDRGHDVTVVAQ